MTVPSSRSAPRGLPVRSGGPDTSSTSSRIWNATPSRSPNAPERAGQVGPVAEQRSQPAGRLEQARRLQPAALEVALGRHVVAPGVGALHQLAAGERRRRRRTARARRPRCRWRPARRTRARRAGRRWPSRPSGRRRRTRSAGRGAARAPSSTSSCTSVAMWSSSTATPAATSRSSASPSAHRNTSTGRSRLPPAASVPPACRPSSSPWPSVTRASRSSVRSSRRGELRAARGEHRAELCLCGVRHAALRPPEWIAMIPPAVRIQRTSARPAAAIRPPSSAGPGNRRTLLGRYV